MTQRYRLECTACPFQTTVTGEFSATVAAVEEHQQASDAAPGEHFVNVRRVDRSVLLEE